MRTQTGFGFDSHLFGRSGTLILGGLRFPGHPALKGHSDGDALLHAVVDALLGAGTLGDIGRFFPDTDPSTKGLSSRVMVKKAVSRLKAEGFSPVHIDVTVVLEKPKLSQHSLEIRKILAEILHLPLKQVSVKAKTPEGLNLFKSPGGVAVWAVATVRTS
jgi:2-C-methyl-D-erythritol 2,4-cyclodiphosphate synthase